MSLIVTENLCKRWTDKDVLRNVNVTVAPLARVGLVGPNGQGKTTLLRILSGLEEPSDGRVSRKTDLRVAYLPQDPPALAGSTIHQAMLEVFADLHRIEQELADLSHQMGQELPSRDREGADQPTPQPNGTSPAGDSGNLTASRTPAGETPARLADKMSAPHAKLLERFGELQHQFEDRGGYTYAHRIEQILTGLGFARELWDRPLSQLSGGQRTRAYLAKLLLEDPEVLLLDEPTNHLDMEAVEWLEKWLADFRGAIVVVSHDRYFLDRVTDATWEVSFASVECYRGSYSQYVTKRQARYEERLKLYEAQQEYIEETEEFIRRFLAGQRSKEAQGRRTRLERFRKTEAIPQPRQHEKISVRLRVMERTGDKVLDLNELAIGYEKDKPLVQIEKLEIQRGWRVAIVGPNGCGKTTLLRTILGQLPPLGGTTRRGANVHLGYLSQTHAELSPEMTAVEAVRQLDTSMTPERARNVLGSLLLAQEEALKPISELSGGQRSRVVLAKLMLQHANVLILDEPTNHLDVNSQEVLQDVLSEFDGTIILVSHDRYLIQALSTHLWAIDGGQITQLSGGWDRYMQWRQEQLGEPEPDAAAQQAARDKQQRKDDFQQRRKRTNEVQKFQRRLAEVEATIHKIELEVKSLNERINEAGQAGQVDKVTELGEKYAADNERLEELLTEWEQLSASLEDLGAE